LPRSLLDTADLSTLRAGGGGRFGGALAALVGAGTVQQDPDDPRWADRDRFVLGAPAARDPVRAAFAASPAHPDEGWLDGGAAGHALGLACGVAASSQLDGGIFSAYCLVDAAALDDGRTWEVLRSAAAAQLWTLRPLGVVEPGPAETLTALLQAAGWKVARAAADDVAEILGALDQVISRRQPPTAVVAVAE
jgi:transketolase